MLIGGIAELGEAPGLFHYAPAAHGLERRADCPEALLARLLRGLPPQAFRVALASVHWREAWKYGERAFRYCQHDIGHAIGALRIAAAALGWSALGLAAGACCGLTSRTSERPAGRMRRTQRRRYGHETSTDSRVAGRAPA